MSDTASTLTCRPATNADCPQVETLVFTVLAEYGLAPEPDGVDRDLRDLENYYFSSGGWFGVWTDHTGRICGTAGIAPVNGATCELRKMYLSPANRGQGAGRLMLERAFAEAKRLGYQRMILETATVLRDAVKLYERNGFVKITPEAHTAKRCDLVMGRSL